MLTINVAANKAAGRTVVHALRILPPGAVPAPGPADVAPATLAAPEVPEALVKTREMASPSFHQALAAHQAVAPARRLDPGTARAVERQTAALRALSHRAFPEPEMSPDDQPAPIEVTRAERRRRAAATEAAALCRARAERGRRPHTDDAPVPHQLG
ncbi:hypothetical protein [Streptomyces sp. NBC_00872]|uniref:hypothetical protein n=1 Tax=Streptomyces sp. NBC_00872 TaxID=2903686 RepID=UPI003862F3FD|nr:hypothetical protein OG214_34450 [Streptomyces sp. NBC_00872]